MSGGPPPLPLIPYPSWLEDLLGQAAGPGGAGPLGTAGNPLTPDAANALFAELSAQGHIPFNWPRDGCFARAHEMRRLMAEKGVESAKYWNYASPGEVLTVPGTSIGTVEWGWHVAPSVMVQGPNGPQPMVIDPSLFDKPVTPQEWAAKQGDAASVLQPSDGSLYFRAQDETWSETDDSYTQTQEDLERYRLERAIWDTGIDPATGLPHP